MRDQDTKQQEMANLRKELRALRRYRRVVRAQGKVFSTIGGISSLVFLGPDLSVAVSQWLKAKSKSDDGDSINLTANLVAALIRRVVRVGLIAITLALIPTALLFWQNIIMRDQYSALITQIDEQRAQTENQQITSYFPLLLSGDRKQFWAAVSYFSSNETLASEAVSRLSRMLLESEGEGACSSLEALARLSPPRSLDDGTPVRDVTRTLIPLIEFQEIPLGGIEIRELECEGITLRQTGISQLSLRESNLRNSELSYVDVSGTSFENSDLRGAHFLFGTQWSSEEAGRSADFTDADLRYSLFREEISNVILNGADLSGALFYWVTGEKLKQMPKRYFRGALCMSSTEAETCHKWHLNNFRESAPDVNKPASCPTLIEYPIIGVFGHEPERRQCAEWFESA